MLANSDTVILGLGDSYLQGSEAGGAEHSFLNQYCNQKGFDCVNMGHEGIGNLGSVYKALIYDIDWSQWNNKYIFWMPTGLNRFDMANRLWNPDDNWGVVRNSPIFTPFPNKQPHEQWSESRKKLESALVDFTTPQTARQDFLTAYQILKNFYDAKGFNKLFIFPAFNDETTRKIMKDFRKTPSTQGIYKMNEGLFKRMGWEYYITVDGSNNYYQWLCQKAGLPLSTQPHDTMDANRDNIRNETVEKWIAPRSHATRKANIVFSRRLIEVLDL